MVQHLEHYFLGPFRATLGGESITGFGTDKVRALLAYLAVEGRHAHRREALAGLLWPNSPESDALVSLRQALRRLRQALGLKTDEDTQTTRDNQSPLLLVTPQTIQLAPGGYYLDVDEFTELVQACQSHRHRKIEHCSTCHARLRRAAELYQGDFLAGFLPDDTEPFDEWLVLTRERLRRQALEVFAHLALYYETRNDPAQALHYAYRQIEMEPWREDVHRQAMRLLATTGQRPAALAQYETCRRMLNQELGIEPEVETIALYERIKTGLLESGVTSAGTQGNAKTRHNIPPQLTVFVGREEALRSIGERLDSVECRLITLVGPGGVGKTRLAIQAASEQVGAFDDGVWLVELAALTDAGLVPSNIAQALGVKEAAGKPLVDTLKTYLADKELLLVLDNFEQVLGASEAVAVLIKAAPEMKVLVTSRVKLNVYGEHEYGVPPLSLPDIRHLPPPEDLSRYDAVRLFIERARAARVDFEVSHDNAPALAEICVRLDGLPLAIELAAARIKMLPPEALLPRLSQRLKLLTGGARDLPARQQTLRNTIQWSYDLLSAEEQQLFWRMAPFSGGRTLEALEEVCNYNGQLQIDVFDGVQSLLDKSLLQQSVGGRGGDGEPRFRMLETIHEYSREKLEESEEAEALYREHAHYFMRFVEEAAPHLEGAGQQEWLERLGEEHNNIRAALSWSKEKGESARGEISRSVSSSVEVGLRIAGAIRLFWVTRGYDSEGRALVGELLSLPEEILEGCTPRSRAWAMITAGRLALGQGEYDVARRLFEGALTLGKEAEDKRSIALSLDRLGNVSWRQGDQVTARSLFEESLAMSRGIGDKGAIALTLIGLGGAAMRQGDHQATRNMYEESLAIYRELGDKWGTGYSLVGLGNAAYIQGEYGTARSMYEESLTLYRELGDESGIAGSLNNLGNISYMQGSYREAHSLHMESLLISRELGYKEAIAWNIAGLGEAAIGLGLRQSEGTAGRADKVKDVEMGVKLLGASDALHQATGHPREADDTIPYEHAAEAARKAIGKEEFERLLREGRTMKMDQAIAHAIRSAAGEAGE